MAEYLGNKVAELTGAPVKIHAASYETMADILADCVRYENIIIGTPTYSMELFPVIEALMRALTVREIKTRSSACSAPTHGLPERRCAVSTITLSR